MADRFFASYEDEFSSRANAGRGSSSIMPNAADARYYGAPEPHWPQQHWHDPDTQDQRFQADPNDVPYHETYDFAPQQPMFAPLDRRPAKAGISNPTAPSYPAQTRQTHTSYDHDGFRACDGGAAPTYAQPAMTMPADRIAKITQWAGTVCSVLVLLGAVYWAYELAVRDARGIPVVRAAEGPLRIAPTTPGGEISANQGLAVNAVAAKGGSETLPDVVTLAPAPTQLAQEDVAETASAETASAEAPAAIEANAAETVADTPIMAETLTDQTGSALTDLAAKTPDVMPISDEAAVEAALAMALSDGNEPATMSNTDAAQPAELVSQDVAPDTGVTAPPTSEIDPATIPAGTKLVQLGAFDDDASARAAWAGLQTQFTDLIGTKALVVQQAKSGGRVFFRLRAHGFADEDETRRFCAALLAENASCIPVSQR